MKNNLLALALLLFSVAAASAQDLITKKNGEDIQAKVLEVALDQVHYKLYNNLTGPIYSVAKSDLLMIRYENGTKDIFIKNEKPAPAASAGPAVLQEDMYRKGLRDADRYYTNHKGAATGTLVTAALAGPLFGLIPASLTSATPPREHNLNIPSATLLENYEYYQGFREGARKKKSRKVWTNYGIGVVIGLVTYIALTN